MLKIHNDYRKITSFTICNYDQSNSIFIKEPPGTVSYVAMNGCMLIQGTNYHIVYPEIEDKVTIIFTEAPLITDRIVVTFDLCEFYFSWCPACGKKHRKASYPTDTCIICGTTTVSLDIDSTIYSCLPEFCSKGDIVEASLGIAI